MYNLPNSDCEKYHQKSANKKRTFHLNFTTEISELIMCHFNVFKILKKSINYPPVPIGKNAHKITHICIHKFK